VRSIAVVGGAVAGLRAAEALRDAGYEGRLSVVSRETEMPYERPELSKDFLLGKTPEEDLRLREDEDYEDLALDWLGGCSARALDVRAQAVLLDTGESLHVDGVVIATGAKPRGLRALTPWRPGMFSLRTMQDAIALREVLVAEPRVVVVGGGLIGTEFASVCRAKGLQVTVLEPEAVPLRRVLGPELAAVVGSAQRDAGVVLRCGDALEEVIGTERVEAVRTASGAVLQCDLLLCAVGAEPETAWLEGSPIALEDGIRCTSSGMTSVPSVVACGDVASFYDPNVGRHRRGQHWTAAMEQPEVAAKALLSPADHAPYATVPYFWTEQFGLYVQVAGYISGEARLHVIEGSSAETSLYGQMVVDGRVEAVVGVNATSPFARLQAQLGEDLAALPDQGERSRT
jgi:3-phenylpropionate/trans-cinnamate dioxygenase ferredoxin reductase subunit